MSRRRYARYPGIGGKFDLHGLCDVARRHGMQIISACKPDMHFYNEIGLYGTLEQMQAVDAEWAAAGHKRKPRSFQSVFGVNLKVPRTEWVDEEART